ncbi:MAG: glucose-6-phosphate isomerase [Bacillota bacterium]
MEPGNNKQDLQLENIPDKLLENLLNRLKNKRIVERIWSGDYTIWKNDPTEISNRLGWLDSHEKMACAVAEIESFADEVRGQGYTDALLLGMGGSSLAPEVFRKVFGVQKGHPDLEILDSTDPGAILEKERHLDFKKTLFIVSTKSGSTIETIALMKYFYNQVVQALGKDQAGNNFIAITDPESGLEKTAGALGFRKVFLNDPAIGGRYSALSYFGLVPAALNGIDLKRLLERASSMAAKAKAFDPQKENKNSSALLGAALGVLGINGRDKITFLFPEKIKPFADWVEQLIAESTGKEGTGLLPVWGSPVIPPERYTGDRAFIYYHLDEKDPGDKKVESLIEAGHPVIKISLHDLYDLGGECFRWMMATAIAGWALGINPFNQPNVEAAKVRAREMVETYRQKGTLPEQKPDLEAEEIKVYSEFQAESLPQAWNTFLEQASPGEPGGGGKSYLAIQAYVKPDPETDRALRELRNALEARTKMAVTTGYGPRYLHSTGQLHKGDAGNGLFVQITGASKQDLPIPDKPGSNDSSLTFGVLKNAQAMGDYLALKEKGRPVIRFHLEDDVASAIKRLTETVS